MPHIAGNVEFTHNQLPYRTMHNFMALFNDIPIVLHRQLFDHGKMLQQLFLKLPIWSRPYKDVRAKSRKIDLPSPCPLNVCTGSTPPLSVRIHLKFWKIRCFLHQKVRTSASKKLPPCPQNVRTRQPLPLTADIFHKQSLSLFLSAGSVHKYYDG